MVVSKGGRAGGQEALYNFNVRLVPVNWLLRGGFCL